MNRFKSLVMALVTLTLLLVTIVLFFLTGYYLYKDNSGIAGVIIAMVGVLAPIVGCLIKLLLNNNSKHLLIERRLFDEHFVDREIEYIKLTRLIKEQEERIISISGKYGMGKSLFAKMFCDQVNYTDLKKWKGYSALYYSHTKKNKIELGISNNFVMTSNASIPEISKSIHNRLTSKHCILFIDNLDDIEKFEALEFAKAFISCNQANTVVLVIDSTENDFHIYPSEFGKKEIQMLANSFNINISEPVQSKLSELSCGYPVYARYNVEAYIKGKDIVECENMDGYVKTLIDSLNQLEQEILSLIIIITQMTQEEVSYDELLSLDNRISRVHIKKLSILSLIEDYNKNYYVDKLIAYICKDYLTEYTDTNLSKIYNHYLNISNYKYLSLCAAVQSNFEVDIEFVCNQLKKQYQEGSFYLLISLGELDFQNRINLHIRKDKHCWTILKYYHLKSLLELGLYDKARMIVDKANDVFDSTINIMNIQNALDFEYQYLLIDLEHLTNHFEDACEFSQALSLQALQKEQQSKCKYLYAHCLRHMGESLEEAYNLFMELWDDKKHADEKTRIRSLYSAASIKMFQNDLEYAYEDEFDKIEQLFICNMNNEIWRPYVNRHKAIYEYKIKHNFVEAESILLQTIKQLQVTSLRIKYDIYFELAEVYRLQPSKQELYQNSLNNYCEAIGYAKSAGDFNLESNCQMGIILLDMKYGRSVPANCMDDIITRSQKCKLTINYNNAIYIRHLIQKQKVQKELVSYWEKMKYSDLLLAAKNKSEKYNLKLTVM